MHLVLRFGALVCGLLTAAGAFAQPRPIRALIFSGANNHDWRTTTPRLRQILADSGRFDVRVEERPAGTTAATLDGFDLLVLDYNGPRWGAASESAVAAFVKSGKGLVVVHGASWAFGGLEVLGDRHVRTGIMEPAWEEYAHMIGGIWSEAEPKTGHGKRHSFRVKFTDREHPIARGTGDSFIATDELYHHMRMRSEAHVIATAFDDPAFGGTGKDEPILWTVNYGAGRVFHTTLGHDLNAMSENGFVSSFVRGSEWAATGTVTIPHPDPKPLRALVVTGGHDYDTSFYSLFQDLNWRHVASAAEAFRKDIRPDADVLVLYDFTKDLAEPQRQHLREFVESGKGVVVLHHAIADYNAWPWWYREVVGGKYQLEADASTPASTYVHDEELFVTPAASHPIVDSVGPMHLWDETYKQMWISPEVKVLLRTGNRTSDGPVAWISPYLKSRVVYIQLGHGHTAHAHPAYRQLVRNAMFWASGTEVPPTGSNRYSR